MNNHVKEVLNSIVERFQSGDIPEAIAYVTFPIANIPSTRWSYLNRLFMIFSGTTDARGIRQWNQVGRTVKKGAKAIYILVPRFIKTQGRTKDEEEHILKGFLAKPVFRVEDTEGEPLEYETESPITDLPLMERAQEWGISVSGISHRFTFYGMYVPREKAIVLATPEETVFFHELSHAAYEMTVCDLLPGQRWDQEIVAELSAQALCRLVGKQPNDTLGNSYRYISHYAKEAGLSPVTACLTVLEKVEKILSRILEIGPEDSAPPFQQGSNNRILEQALITTNIHQQP
jgi:antirestriction protein ArdC